MPSQQGTNCFPWHLFQPTFPDLVWTLFQCQNCIRQNPSLPSSPLWHTSGRSLSRKGQRAMLSRFFPRTRLDLPRGMHKPDASHSLVTTPLRVTPRSFNACRTHCIVLLMQLKAILNADVCPRRIRPKSARESKWLAIRHPLIMASVGLSAGRLGVSTISNYCWTTASSAAKEHRANMPPLTAPR